MARAVDAGAVVAKARRALARLAGTDEYHARLVAELLVMRCDAAARPCSELLAAADPEAALPLRAALAERLAAHAGTAMVAAPLAELLRADRESALRACEPAESVDVAALAARMTAALELRALAERRDDHHPTWCVTEHEHWAAVLRGARLRALAGALAPPHPEVRALAKSVVLVVAGDLRGCAPIAWALESSGATTLLADGMPSAVELLRTFEVDAIVADLDGAGADLARLPAAIEAVRDRAPLLIALVAPARSAAEGFDLVVARGPGVELHALLVSALSDLARAARAPRP